MVGRHLSLDGRRRRRALLEHGRGRSRRRPRRAWRAGRSARRESACGPARRGGGDPRLRRHAAVVDRHPLRLARLRRPGLLLVAVLLAACRARAVAPDASPVARLHVVMVNGGGSKAQNYQSHFLHLRRLLALLDGAGVPSDRITVFSADGDDPEADMAVREIEPDTDFQLLRGTHLGAALGAQIVYANSEIPGVPLRAAARAELPTWVKRAPTQVRP